MSWDMLPTEIKMLIFKQLNIIYENNVKKIQNKWHTFKNKQDIIRYLWEKYERDDPVSWGDYNYNHEPYLINLRTDKLLRFTCKYLSTNQLIDEQEITYWKIRINLINFSLFIEEYTGGQGCLIYHSIEDNMHIIQNKFNLPIIDSMGYEY